MMIKLPNYTFKPLRERISFHSIHRSKLEIVLEDSLCNVNYSDPCREGQPPSRTIVERTGDMQIRSDDRDGTKSEI